MILGAPPARLRADIWTRTTADVGHMDSARRGRLAERLPRLLPPRQRLSPSRLMRTESPDASRWDPCHSWPAIGVFGSGSPGASASDFPLPTRGDVLLPGLVRHSPISSRLPAVVEEDHDHSPCQSETESPRVLRNCGARGAQRPLGAAFPKMTLHPEAGRTRMSGVIVNQSHVHGILESLLGLGIELLSLNEVSGKQLPAAPEKR